MSKRSSTSLRESNKSSDIRKAPKDGFRKPSKKKKTYLESNSSDDNSESSSELTSEELVTSVKACKLCEKSGSKKSRSSKIPKKTILSSETSSDESTDSESEEFIDMNKKETSSKSKKTKKKKRNDNEIFKELINNQLKDVPSAWKLSINDMKRICKYIDKSIFDEDECCKWNGYVTNMNNSNKGTYVNFYFRNKKVALHRLLYSNFIEPLSSGEYLKFTCDNHGVCCNVNHYDKYKYSKTNPEVRKETKVKESKKDMKEVSIICEDDGDLVVDFE